MRYQWLDKYLLQKRGVTKDFQPVWNWVRSDGAVPDDLLREMLDKSYGMVLEGLSKKAQRLAVGLTVCGQKCEECGFYEKNCPGCNESGGKVFHAPTGKACSIYACAANRKRLTHCGLCGEVPCQLWRDTRDPALSDQEFEEDLHHRLEQLKEVTPHGV